MTMQETIQAFAAMHTTGQYGKLTLAQLKAMCEFANDHHAVLLAMTKPTPEPDGFWVGGDGEGEYESADKHSADVDPVLDTINQHTTLRHMTPPFEMNGERCCNCGLPAETSRVGMKWCVDCLVELDEDFRD